MTSTQHVLHALAGYDICSVCNNGVTRQGSWIEIAYPLGIGQLDRLSYTGGFTGSFTSGASLVATLPWPRDIVDETSVTAIPSHHCTACHVDFYGAREYDGHRASPRGDACVVHVPEIARCWTCDQPWRAAPGWKWSSVSGGFFAGHTCATEEP